MRKRLHFLTRHRGVISVLGISLVLYLLPARYAYPVTGRIASASANIAVFFQSQPGQKETLPAVEQLRRDIILTQQQLAAARNEVHLLQRELESVTGVKSTSIVELASIIPARVVLHRDASNFRCTILVNRGSEQGVRPGMPVLWGCEYPQESSLHACVVGIVDTVGPRACRILLASDPGFRVPARVLESRRRAIVEGKSAGTHPMRLKHVDPGTEIAVGDTVTTSGSLGIFPSGLLVGIVAEVKGREYTGELEITVASPVDLDELESVVIIELAPHGVPEENK